MKDNMVVRVFDTEAALAEAVADHICSTITSRRQEGENTVLGLAAGASPKIVYKELTRRHSEEGFSFSDCHTFALDEFYPLLQIEAGSLNRQLSEYLNGTGIPIQNRHILTGYILPDEIDAFCRAYELRIARLGGIDLQLLGIGRNGHIAFNEPGSSRDSRTRVVTLSEITRLDSARSFGLVQAVPKMALTVGIGSILEAKEIILIALGDHKAPVVERLVNGDANDFIPASYLKSHSAFTLCVDKLAARNLSL